MTATLTTFLQWLTVLTVTGGGMGPPLGIPPAAQDPVMERVAPEQCLFYASWTGAATADPNSRNQTEQLAAEPEVKNFTGQITKTFGDALRQCGTNEPEGNELVCKWIELVFTRPTAIFISAPR